MDRPLEIAFHNLPSSPELEQAIRQGVAHLEKLYPRVVGCRVSVEAAHRRHRKGNVPDVHIEVDVPGRRIAVSREPRRTRQHHVDPDVSSSLHDAFEAVSKRLLDYKRIQAREVKPHPAALRGHISRIYRQRDYGFLVSANGSELYFHRNSVIDGGFDSLAEGLSVDYIESAGDTGPTASKVWLAGTRAT